MTFHKSLIKICLEEEENEVFLVSEYEPKQSMILKILDIHHNKSYIGQTSDLDLRTQAARIGLTFSDFIDQSKQALFQESSKESTYIYALHKRNFNYQFEWKSIDEEETVITLGCIEMTEKQYATVFDSVLICLAKEILDLNSKVKSLTAELVECKSQTENAINQLSEAVDVKEKLEKELFSKFVLVLNEKKKRIRELSSDKLPGSSKISMKKKATSKKTRIHSVSDSEEENADELLNIPGPSTSLKRSSLSFLDNEEEAGPSTSVKRSSLPFLDDEEDSVVPVTKPTKIRNRNIGNKTKIFPEEIMPAKVESTFSQVMDDDSDDLLNEL